MCFIEGDIAWGQSTLEECRLGAVLARHGLVAQEVLDQVYQLVGDGKRLGEVLLELGALDRDRLDDALALQVRETLLCVFAWPDGAWHFEDHVRESFRGYDRPLRLSTADLILDAVWCIEDQALIRHGLGDLERPLSLAHDTLSRAQRLKLGPTELRLLGLADGVRSARESLELAALDPQEAQRGLLGLLCTGMLEWREAPRGAASVDSREPSPPPAPVDFDEPEAVLEGAETEFTAGRQWDALQAVEAVMDKLQGRPRTRALLLRARVYAQTPSTRRQAQELLTEVLKADPSNAEVYFELGRLYKCAGVLKTAHAMFRRVLELRPRHARARRELGSAA